MNEGAFGSHELTLDMRVVDVATGADVSEVLRQRVRAEPLARCVAEAAKTSSYKRHRVFDAFPFFNEEKVLEVRLRELDDSVDVFVPVESTVTHNGGPTSRSGLPATRFAVQTLRAARGFVYRGCVKRGPGPEPRRRRPYGASGSSATPSSTRLRKPAPLRATSSFCPTPTRFPIPTVERRARLPRLFNGRKGPAGGVAHGLAPV